MNFLCNLAGVAKYAGQRAGRSVPAAGGTAFEAGASTRHKPRSKDSRDERPNCQFDSLRQSQSFSRPPGTVDAISDFIASS